MIETTHNGYTIRYAENEDVWRCHELDVQGKSLAACKTAINKVDADARRVGNVLVIILDHWGRPAFGQVTIIDGDEAWVTIIERKKRAAGMYEQKTRRKHKLSSLVLDTPANRERIAAAAAEDRNAEHHQKEALAIRQAIPRVTVDDLKATPEKALSA